ncbi:SlyX protein [plant metagenome]|uniref:SlyX protein n=2 Tax=plant metagenome TaxID=1297885 RepID=A0A484QYH4_9ZZZZ
MPMATDIMTDTDELPDLQALAKRLFDLEIKAGLADDMLDQLNQTIFRQQRQIELLGKELFELRRQGQEGPGTPRNLRDELPPHY